MLKDFLYLKEKNLKDVIELLLKSYASLFSDSEQTLKRHSLGKAHHRLIILIDNNPGIKVTKILNMLKVTKQSLNRVLQDLIKKDFIIQKKDEKDGREKKIYLSDRGLEFANNLFNSQKNRVLSAFKKSSPDEVHYFKNVLKRILE
ncbi:MAG: MarR family transcriptional regulator [Pelagibacteraceae bacterium]|jgi:DNA-binding MarR family transcriptional regulator|tara:strand:+ start:586 stop:1023 length:438 start_codon:yes stop_codon:yes gene_type:complete